ncbi:hypothetical protein AAFF_G00437560 [Aldrovandia affinis]|uniref:NF-kappa-B essential modulator NEMO CC2-LZ domain-containing protein n=1 Tax=Aldrovandia affinis TaxID=143900 RepID=A0AAD7S7M7_9TELE|nr:hypothetical protein AAFF_G00437560 [Aldrovandia affinis]
MMETFNEMRQNRRLIKQLDADMLNCGQSDRCDSVELDSGLRSQVKGCQPSHDAVGRGRGQEEGPGLQTVAFTEVFTEAAARMSRESLKVTGEAVGPKGVLSDFVPGALHHRLTALERQRLELLEVNKKWDEQYQSMKRHYEAKITELRKMLEACDARAPDEEETKHRHLEGQLQEAERTTEAVLKRNSVVCAELLEAERQTQRLRLQNTTLTRRGQQQQSEIRRLNEVLSETLSSKVEEVEVLRHQVRIYEEDFRKERVDRERLQGRSDGLEGRLRALRSEVEQVRSQVTRTNTCTPKPRSAVPSGVRTLSPNAPPHPAHRPAPPGQHSAMCPRHPAATS